MEQLTYAISEAGGVTELANSLGVSQPCVSNWIARGRVPSGWLAFLCVKFPMPKPTKSQASRAQAAIKTEAEAA